MAYKWNKCAHALVSFDFINKTDSRRVNEVNVEANWYFTKRAENTPPPKEKNKLVDRKPSLISRLVITNCRYRDSIVKRARSRSDLRLTFRWRIPAFDQKHIRSLARTSPPFMWRLIDTWFPPRRECIYQKRDTRSDLASARCVRARTLPPVILPCIYVIRRYNNVVIYAEYIRMYRNINNTTFGRVIIISLN